MIRHTPRSTLSHTLCPYTTHLLAGVATAGVDVFVVGDGVGHAVAGRRAELALAQLCARPQNGGGQSRRLPAAAPCHGGWHASCVLSPCTRSGKREGAQAGNRNRAGQAHYGVAPGPNVGGHSADRKSTRLNSSP